jgi:hypothetical protein
MSDARLRALAREVALTGGFEARVRLLVLRARAGDLPLERLRLAAYLRDPAAKRALAPDVPRAPSEVTRVVAGLAHYGLEACLRAAVAIGRVADPELIAEQRLSMRELLDGLTLWLECPCGDHARDVRQAARLAEGGHAAGPLLLWAATAVTDPGVDALAAWQLLWRPFSVRHASELDWDWRQPRPLGFVQRERAGVVHALRARLVPWALG